MRTELYDLKKDVGENNDLSSKHPRRVKKLEKLMNKERQPSDHTLFQIK